MIRWAMKLLVTLGVHGKLHKASRQLLNIPNYIDKKRKRFERVKDQLRMMGIGPDFGEAA